MTEKAMPQGCHCDPDDWPDTPEPICPSFESEAGTDDCDHCFHRRECHSRVGPLYCTCPVVIDPFCTGDTHYRERDCKHPETCERRIIDDERPEEE